MSTNLSQFDLLDHFDTHLSEDERQLANIEVCKIIWKILAHVIVQKLTHWDEW